MSKNNYLSRQEAIDVLRTVASTGLLADEIEEELDEIANLISYELDGEHFWGQSYESGDKLRVAYREDLWTDKLVMEVSAQHNNARFIPAPNEIQELRDYFYETRGIDEECDIEDQQQCENDFIDHYGLNNIH